MIINSIFILLHVYHINQFLVNKIKDLIFKFYLFCFFFYTDLEFVCVGTWIENHHTYFVTRILSHPTKRQRNHQNNQYACFVN